MKKLSESRKRTISDTKAVTEKISADVNGYEKIKKACKQYNLKKQFLLHVANHVFACDPALFGRNKPGRIATRKVDAIYCWFRDYGPQFIHVIREHYPHVWEKILQISPACTPTDVLNVFNGFFQEENEKCPARVSIDSIFSDNFCLVDDELIDNIFTF
ncbi:hypothetical protein TRFO_37663 [Tritrichomonas foetus]|uniref:Uncharacterized protein n=1 Tax=Tritrichomonas foetus TaxID=1144522 RepID=A0A1J4JBW8_9EUKA|nr:hypothetical protein TRFO_37663 [Tritrichomonas foetus]|eukprot:OHS96153.1 hypothetical protein TRFO_37663 [Tritrichomonas foetus]